MANGFGSEPFGKVPFGSGTPFATSYGKPVREVFITNITAATTLVFPGGNGKVNGTPASSPVYIVDYGYFEIEWDSTVANERHRAVIFFIPPDLKVRLNGISYYGSDFDRWAKIKKELGDGFQYDQSDLAVPFYDKDGTGNALPYLVRVFVSSPVLVDIVAERVNDQDGIDLVQISNLRAIRSGESLSGRFGAPRAVTSLKLQADFIAGPFEFNGSGELISNEGYEGPLLTAICSGDFFDAMSMALGQTQSTFGSP